MTINEITEILKKAITDPKYKPKTKKELFSYLKASDNKKWEAALDVLLKEGVCFLSKREKILDSLSSGLVPSTFSSSDRGFGFAVPNDKKDGEDIFIPARYTMGAMHGDRILAKVCNIDKDGRKDGEVTGITDRRTKELVGTLEIYPSCGKVTPDNKKFCNQIFISRKSIKKAKTGDKVAVAITKYAASKGGLEGDIIRVFGPEQSKTANYDSILFARHIRQKFPKEVLSEADLLSVEVSEADKAGRFDLTKELIFTIDGADAKDFDDAISLTKKENGNYLLGVHIADVSHYVKENSPIDKEAFARGTSIYFVDQVVPMLPVSLSNGICSLNPDVTRLAFSVFMEFDEGGNRKDFYLKKSVIKSCARLIYSEVSDVLENIACEEIAKKHDKLKNTLFEMKKLSALLRKQRKNRGAIDFDFPEAKIIIDESGEPIDIQKRERGVSDMMIEDFMLATNETIAEYVFHLESPFVYRIHEHPDPLKMASFLNTAEIFGAAIPKKKDDLTPETLQKLLDEIKGKPYERTLASLALRAMQKAHYFEQNLGHFGLAAKYYTHFTSPIRRYSDLAIHRILSEMLLGTLSEKTKKRFEAFAKEAALRASETEQNAVDTEREIDDLYMAIYMKNHIGDEFDGFISSVTSFGFFVELENTVEGLVHITTLKADNYIFDADTLSLRGERTGKTFRIGDNAHIQVANSDVVSRQIDFTLIEKVEDS